jgi:hypothetical protein
VVRDYIREAPLASPSAATAAAGRGFAAASSSSSAEPPLVRPCPLTSALHRAAAAAEAGLANSPDAVGYACPDDEVTLWDLAVQARAAQAPAAPRRFMVNRVSGKVHLALAPDAPGGPPRESACCWSFSTGSVASVPALPAAPRLICSKCFPTEHSEAKARPAAAIVSLAA